ncbi:DNA polymerase kappa [Pseudophryne corroboree]|uniref:DNA polymerase kappa n=1 Tax=Pseudophryne corroboree TaxID=495146 RepID=UPI0030817CAB
MDQPKDKEIAPSNEAFQFRMGLNDNKAGMEGLDKEKINKIIMDVTKGSRFYDNELKKDQQVNQRIEKMLQQKSLLTSSQIRKAQIQVDRLALELERRRDLSRVIVHIDMDAFYAAVEMRDNPELRDKPMAVGSMSMLSTSNYLARRFGVRAAMPGFIAKKLCPNLTIVPLNFDKYRAVSKEVREIFADYDPNFLPLSLDEAYVDITAHLEERLTWPEERRRFVIRSGCSDNVGIPSGVEPVTCEAEQVQCTSPVLFEDSPPFLLEENLVLPGQDKELLNEQQAVENVIAFGASAEEAVQEMRFRIEQKTTLTASAGIAPNMMLAKVCSDKNKPNGQYVIPHDRQAVMDFIKDLPIRKVPGVGKVTEKMLRALGIITCTDLYQQRALLSLLFSEISWHNFLNISLGLGSTHIEKDGERKSMSTERTFSEINVAEEQYELCRELCKDLAEDLRKEALKGRTVTLKLKNVKFEVKTRASTVSYAVSTEEEIFSVAKEILKAEIDLSSPEPLRLRLMGVRVSGFLPEDEKWHQKSITSFLCTSKPTERMCSLEKPDPANQGTQAPAPQRESFFNQKRAARQLGVFEGSTSHDVTSREPITTAVSYQEQEEETKVDDICQEPDFTCPICLMKQSGWDLFGFNKHIDMCLSKSPPSSGVGTSNRCKDLPVGTSGVSCEESGNEDHKNNLKNKMVTVAPGDDLEDFVIDKNSMIIRKPDLKMNQNIYNDDVTCDSPLEDFDLGSHDGIKGPDCKAAAPPSPAVSLGDSTLICPVCNLQQDTTDLATFNRHVDVCLNKGILEELRGDTVNRDTHNTVKNIQQNGNTGRKNESSKSTARTKRPGTTQQNPASKKAKTSRSCNTIDKFFK